MTLHNQSNARTHRTPKALGAKCRQNLFRFAEALGVRAHTRVAFTMVFITVSTTLCGEELSRKSKAPRETYPNVDVIYASVTAPDGNRLRTIITKPRQVTSCVNANAPTIVSERISTLAKTGRLTDIAANHCIAIL